jgi:hypothetical protein
MWERSSGSVWGPRQLFTRVAARPMASKLLKRLARPERFERPTLRFVV